MCRRAYGEIRLHRPLGDQLQLFMQHLPAQRTRVPGYDDMLTTEQVAAMMPTATHAAGSRRGFYLGYTLSGSRQPVLLSLREGSDSDRNTTILSVGALGSGKTTLAQKLTYEGFLQGARVIDCDPKGDHRFHLLEEVAPHVECVALRPDPTLRGMLDPLRVAPAHLRQDAAVSFLSDLLPARAEAAWETAVVAAVDRVLARARQPTCPEVVSALLRGRRARASRRPHARGLLALGSDPAGLRRRGSAAAPGRRAAGDLPADPRPAGARSGGAPVGVLAVRARGSPDRAPDRDVRDASDERRAIAPEAVLLRRGLAAARRPGRPDAARIAAADGPFGARGADHQHAARRPTRWSASARRWRTSSERRSCSACARRAKRVARSRCSASTKRARGCAAACSSSTRGAACFATTADGWRRFRSTW